MQLKKKFRKTIWILLFVISLCVFIYATYNLISQYLIYYVAEKEYESLTGIAYLTEQKNEGYHSPIDFAALAEINPDIVGWIVIDGTNIDYPIVQDDDNDAYLHITFSGNYNVSGTIFMDYRNAPDFKSPNTIIYGHKMKNSSMFAELTGYKQQSFYKKHPIFTIYTPESEYKCKVFSAYVTTSTSDTYTLRFADTTFTQYINKIVHHSLIQTDITINDTDKIVTLSTCDYQFDNARMIIHAKIE